ncbi:MAG: 3'-5' exonuclease [Hyphomicrobiales bacterium]|nr:MAG: 3'-5' exonuclease [Hyphomicrobiales bacterium]
MQIYEGYGAHVTVDSARLVISKSNVVHMIGGPGAVLPLRAINGSNLKRASRFKNGHLQVLVDGVLPGKPSATEPYTVVFTHRQQATFLSLHEWLHAVAFTNRLSSNAMIPIPAGMRGRGDADQGQASRQVRRVGGLPNPGGVSRPKPSVSTIPSGVQSPEMPSLTPARVSDLIGFRVPDEEPVEWVEHGRPVKVVSPSAPESRTASDVLPTGIDRLLLTRRVTGFAMSDQIFTAVDIETTGLDPASDGIVEIGAVKFTATGEVIDEFATLVNTPGSSESARSVHQIQDQDLDGAPDLAAVLPALLDFMRGTVLVAHNLDFEEPFLTAAFQRHEPVLPAISAICTLQTCRRQLEGRAFSLKAMYKTATGNWLENHHSALADARATAQILQWLVKTAPSTLSLSAPPAAEIRSRATHQCSTKPRPAPKGATLAAIVDSLPHSPTGLAGDPTQFALYKEALSRHLDDGRLSVADVNTLAEHARRTRVTGTQLRELHRQRWEAAFPDEAHADWSQLAQPRRCEMLAVAKALGLPDIFEPLQEVIFSEAEPAPPPESRYLKGIRIGLSGESPEVSALKEQAVGSGASVAVKITKTVVWLATTTPESTDRIHSKARELNIPIIDTAEAKRRLDEAVASAELDIFERRRQYQLFESERQREREEQDAYWRPTWRDIELTFDKPARGFE